LDGLPDTAEPTVANTKRKVEINSARYDRSAGAEKDRCR
jgi:hypothetical protein